MHDICIIFVQYMNNIIIIICKFNLCVLYVRYYYMHIGTSFVLHS